MQLALVLGLDRVGSSQRADVNKLRLEVEEFVPLVLSLIRGSPPFD